MEKKPLKNYPLPEYPTIIEVQDLNELIYCSLPRHWTSKSMRYSALAILLASICNTQSITTETPSDGYEVTVNNSPNPTQTPDKIKTKFSQVAPVFYHGEGAGSTGCVAVSSPIFLPESEAMKIIKSELAKAGITLDVEGVVVPLPTPIEHDKKVFDSLRFEGYSTTFNLLVNFVGWAESSMIFGPSYSTSSYIQTRAAADSLTHILANTKGYKIAQFYDPLVDNAWYGKPEESRAKCEEEKELLASQVRAFLDWAEEHKFITPPDPAANASED